MGCQSACGVEEKSLRKTKPFTAPVLLKKGQYDELRVAKSDSVAFH